MQLPVDVEIVFEDGKRVIEHWDGISRSAEFEYQSSARMISAEIDPERRICLDQNYINNSQTRVPQTTGLRTYFIRCLTSVQHILETITLVM
jgi:hypothetical protein